MPLNMPSSERKHPAKPLSPTDHYRAALQSEGFSRDAAQEQAIQLLQDLYERLCLPQSKHTGLLGKLRTAFGREIKPVPGLYFWGGVGRGKTFIMDIFYDSLPFEEKTRLHFHRFMRMIHRELRVFKGEKNPLEKIAEKLALQTRVLCLDEFFVTDITDAMILANLLQGLFDRGVTLVTTSNIEPDGLYKDGLQRARFLPAIELLKTHTRIVNVDSGVDYRLRALERVELYHYPLDGNCHEIMESNFLKLIADANEIERNTSIEIENREIDAIGVCEDVIWFDFVQICEGPRSQNDYIEIAREFHTVLISCVPIFDKRDDSARRFVNLIDEFYDRNVNVVLSAGAALGELYQSGRLSFEFQRTQSRLLEMQSKEYLGREHKP